MTEDRPAPHGSGDLRQRAERMLQRRLEVGREVSLEDGQHLIHELRVHQIELEMQNDELRGAQEELERSRDSYLDLYDFAPVGYLTLSEEGSILEANLTIATMLGVERADLIRQPFTRFLLSEDQDIYYYHVHRRRLHGSQGLQTCELRMVRKDSAHFHTLVESVVVEAGAGMGLVFRLAISDITERKQAEEALQQSESRWRSLSETSPDHILALDKELIIRHANFASAGLSMANLIGTPLYTHIEDSRQAEIKAILQGVLETGQAARYEATHDAPGGAISHESHAGPVHVGGEVVGITLVARDITERERADNALGESERLLRQVIDAVPATIFVKDRDGNFIVANDFIARAYGTTPEEMVGTNEMDYSVFSPSEVATFLRDDREAIDSRQPKVIAESAMIMADGTTRWFHTVKVPLTVRGNPDCVLGVGVDVTDRVLARRALEEREHYFRSLLYGLHEDIIVVDRSHRITDVNNSVLRLTGHRREEVIGQHCFQIAHGFEEPCDRHGEDCPLPHVFETGKPASCIHDFHRADGSVVTANIMLSPLKDAQGNVTHVIEATRDVSDLIQAQREVRESEELLRQIIDATPAGIFVKDRDGTFILGNNQVAEIYGTTADQLVGTNERDHSVYPADVIEQFLQADRRVIETRQRVVVLEAPARDPDGTPAWFHTVKVPLTVRGDPDCVLAVAVDVTERLQAERALREAEAQLLHQERLAAIGQLAGGVAHDFNNYLTVIMLGAQVALRKPYLPPDLARTFETALEASRRAASLVQQLLDFSRRSLVDSSVLEFGSWLDEFSTILRRTLPESIKVTVQLHGDDCLVNVDQGRIQQALLNLATNARDAMPDGGELSIELLRVVVGPDQKPPLPGMEGGDWICLVVTDTGRGMTADVRSHLFEPFFTTKELGKGIGLGLAQVYGIVMQHKGYIGVDSEPGQGTTFRIYLPSHAEAVVEVEEERPVALRGKGETILLVEDEDGLREVGQEILEGLGYRLLTASQGREALEVYRSANGVDLVITDMVMPQMGGKALMRELRQQHPDQKGLIITGYALSDDLQALRSEGFVDTVLKPFDIETLAKVVRRALDED